MEKMYRRKLKKLLAGALIGAVMSSVLPAVAAEPEIEAIFTEKRTDTQCLTIR